MGKRKNNFMYNFLPFNMHYFNIHGLFFSQKKNQNIKKEIKNARRIYKNYQMKQNFTIMKLQLDLI